MERHGSCLDDLAQGARDQAVRNRVYGEAHRANHAGDRTRQDIVCAGDEAQHHEEEKSVASERGGIRPGLLGKAGQGRMILSPRRGVASSCSRLVIEKTRKTG